MTRVLTGLWVCGLGILAFACSSNNAASGNPAPLGNVGSGATSGSSGSSGTGATGASSSGGSSGTSSGTGGSTASGGGSGPVIDTSSGGSTSTPPSEPSDPDSEAPDGTPSKGEDSGSADGSDGTASPPPSSMPEPPDGSGAGVEPGTLTAGAWDDNLNYGYFSAYRQSMVESQTSGLLPIADDEFDAAHEALAPAPGKKDRLDIALVIDTTGSMGDEIQYLKVEFMTIASTIAASHPNSEQRWSLVVYRDYSDDYVVRSFDFESVLTTFRNNLGAQSAQGGGDFPEAPDQALSALTELSWRDDAATARLAFWVADAPNHPDQAANMATAIRDVASLGIHVYPVASSGIDELTELTMRSTAELTGGRYLFLTDDSGVGGAHKEPTIPCYFVTKLDAAIVRMVDIELSGKYREPSAEEILRTGGNPKSGACSLGSGDSVFVF
ncbi:MAG TPA: vWA domain-containing protein [Polyangiaceae bacterium]|nr:vWA domain-containing protein [Polyangiaceae bacterium]